MCGLLLGTGVYSHPEGLNLSVTNSTKALRVIKVEQSGQEVTVTLRNEYDRRVADYRIGFLRSLSTNSTLIEDSNVTNYFGAPGAIEPGATFKVSFTYPAHADFVRREVVISAVLFEDLSSDGDIENAVKMAAERLGEKFEIERLIPVLQSVLDLPESDLAAHLGRFDKELETQVPSENEVSEALKVLQSHHRDLLSQDRDEWISMISSSLQTGHLGVLRKVRSSRSITDVALIRERLKAHKADFEKRLLR
jgi:hypothetical protein